ncbi:hypothetical protein [Azospirillum argentinense]
MGKMVTIDQAWRRTFSKSMGLLRMERSWSVGNCAEARF